MNKMQFIVSSIIFTIGLSFTLIAICYLVRFYDYGLDFEENSIYFFMLFLFIGIPLVLFGANALSIENKQ